MSGVVSAQPGTLKRRIQTYPFARFPRSGVPAYIRLYPRVASNTLQVGTGGEHLQLAITDNTAAVRCIGFRFGKLEKKLLDHEFFDVAYQPQLNTYNGASNVEFVLADVQFE